VKLEPDLKLAMTLRESPGVYALLIGSGVSRAAGIPTGWEIVLDLICEIAAASKEKPVPDPATWYQSQYGESPDYSRIIDKLATTQTERMNLLRAYFEPTPEEKQEGIKTPTNAHKAISKLVKNGHIRLILTTNFDRLIEQALEEEGITPDVISSDDDLKGALPYVHSKCTVVKLNGDYRDTRIKNTAEELSTYSQSYNSLLDRILDEFGLIVCGWSGEWDTALVQSILRCPNRRFSLFWLTRREPTEEAKRLIDARHGEVITIKSADQFFSELNEKLASLRELDRSVLSTAVAVSAVKRYIVEPQQRIRLSDLFHDELDRVCQELASDRFGTRPDALTREDFQGRIRTYDSLLDQLIAMSAALSHYDTGENSRLLTRCLERLMQFPRQDGLHKLIYLQGYPALLVSYAAGISALAARRFNNLAAVLREPTYRDHVLNKRIPVAFMINTWAVFVEESYTWIPRENAGSESTAVSNYLFDLLRPKLREYAPGNEEYEETFDIFEYLLALNYLELGISETEAPIGRHGWKYGGLRVRFRSLDDSPIADFLRGEIRRGEDSELIRNFFSNDPSRLKEIDQKYHEIIESTTRMWT